MLECQLGEELGFWTWDEDIGCDQKPHPVKPALSQNISERLTRCPPVDTRFDTSCFRCGQISTVEEELRRRQSEGFKNYLPHFNAGIVGGYTGINQLVYPNRCRCG